MDVLIFFNIDNKTFFLIIYYWFFPFVYWTASHLIHQSEGLDYKNIKSYKKERLKELLANIQDVEYIDEHNRARKIKDIGEREIDPYIGFYTLVATLIAMPLSFLSHNYKFETLSFVLIALINIAIVRFKRKRESTSFFVYSIVNSVICSSLFLYFNLNISFETHLKIVIIIGVITILSGLTLGGLKIFSERIEKAVSDKSLCSYGSYTEIYDRKLGNKEKEVLTRLFTFTTGMIIVATIFGLFLD
jgi:hypothetical protein